MSDTQKLKPCDILIDFLKNPTLETFEGLIKSEGDRWIAAFGAEDLVPRVTPKELADWVFRDVEQQLAGLKVLEDSAAHEREAMLAAIEIIIEGKEGEALSSVSEDYPDLVLLLGKVGRR